MNDPRQPAHPQQPQAIPRPGGQTPLGQTPSAQTPSAQPHPPVRPPIGQPPSMGQPRPAGVAPAPRSAINPVPQPVLSRPIAPDQDDAIALVDELAEVDSVPSPTAPVSKIKFGPDISHKKHEWKRKPHITGAGACRVKTFHAKYSDQGLEHIDDAINEWLDGHAEVEVKFVTTTVHVFEGKIREPAIVMNVWY